jgi:hypothetical protein
MQGSDQLLAIAEVGVALAGFTGVIGALGMRDHAAMSDAARLQVWLMLEFSLGTVFFALVPFAPANFGAAETTIWSISSGLMTAFMLVHFLTLGPRIRELIKRGEWIGGLVSRLTALLVIGLFLIQGLNTLGLFFAPSYGLYYLGVLLFVCLAAGNFMALMSVVWKR